LRAAVFPTAQAFFSDVFLDSVDSMLQSLTVILAMLVQVSCTLSIHVPNFSSSHMLLRLPIPPLLPSPPFHLYTMLSPNSRVFIGLSFPG
jgi:hypothetical protein